MESDPICVFDVYVVSILNILGVFLNVVAWLNLDVVLYLCAPFLTIMMSLFSVFPPQGSHGTVVLVYLIFSSSRFRKITLFLGVTNEFLFRRKFKLSFSWCTCWSYSGYASSIGTFRGSTMVNGFG